MIIGRVYDGITPELDAMARKIQDRKPLLARLGGELRKAHVEHFDMKDQRGNSRGFPRKHFWKNEIGRAARSGPLAVDERSVTYTIGGPGAVMLLHKIFGGTVTPKRAGALSIPLSPEAYRTGSASLFKKVLTLIQRKGRPPLLVEKYNINKKTGVARERRAWKIHYILLKSVRHMADKTAMPSVLSVERRIIAKAREYLGRVMNGGTASGVE